MTEYDITSEFETDAIRRHLYNLSKRRAGFVRTLEEAETLMREAIDKAEENDTRIYCFHIRKFPLGVYLIDSFLNLGVSARLYDEFGNLLDRTFCSDLDRDYGTEFGRFRNK